MWSVGSISCTRTVLVVLTTRNFLVPLSPDYFLGEVFITATVFSNKKYVFVMKMNMVNYLESNLLSNITVCCILFMLMYLCKFTILTLQLFI